MTGPRPSEEQLAAAKAVLLSDELPANGRPTAHPKPGTALSFADPEPWPQPVKGVALADEIVSAIDRHVALPISGGVAAALWTLFAHVHDGARTSPLLAITSPTKRCGKTTLLSVLARLVPRPLPSVNITAAALFRVIEIGRPTLLVDEADTFLGQRDELRGILNSGHTAEAAFVLRTVGDGASAEVRRFRTWGPKVLATIGALSDTLADRSITVRLERRKAADVVEPLVAGDGRYSDLLRKATRWAADHPDAAAAEVDTPTGLHDRAADNWRPLLAVATILGGHWPELAWIAAKEFSDTDLGDDSAQVLLLADLREIFEAAEAIPTKDILTALTDREDRPWPEWRQGRPLTGRQLSKLLAPFGVRPRNLRLEDGVKKGYRREQFEDPWTRYLQNATPLHPAPDAGFGEFSSATAPERVADELPLDSAQESQSSGVADSEAG